MAEIQCKEMTKSGEQCKIKAGSSGYCHIHDPEKIAEREAEKRAISSATFEIPALRFSQRSGFKPISKVIQTESMDQELRNSLWNVLSANFLRKYSDGPFLGINYYCGKNIDEFITYLWTSYFKYPLDHLPDTNSGAVKKIFDYFHACEWFEAYDFLEITINYFGALILVKEMNDILTRELSGYRFVGGVFTSITSELEIEMLEDVIADSIFPGVSGHLRRALSLMSDKGNPDYRNSIKESISAVESVARAITGKPKSSLGDALKALEAQRKLHPALKNSFLSLYGYTSDEGGIRHAMLDEPDLNASDAKFFLLSCTSFINYLKSQI